MHVLRILLNVLAAVLFLLLLVYVFLNVHPAAWQYARDFRSGSEPPELLGTYDGTFLAPPWSGSWHGKVFRADGTGANRVGAGEAWPFRWERADGRVVLRYGRDPNPFWIRPIEDQIVTRPDGALLGRITLAVGSWRVPLGWFTIVAATE